jgi:tetratricopeptide (TPR) repeat protein
MANLDDPNFTNDPRLKYMPQSVRVLWDPQNDFRLKRRTKEDWVEARQTYDVYLRVVSEMRRAGVPLLAGTDTANPFCFPGFSLHDELSLLVTAGLTPMEAIQAATRNAADYLGILNSYGTVEKGKTADLVLLDANPLANIRNISKIAGILIGGRYLSRSSLDQMLVDVEAVARLKSVVAPLMKTMVEKSVGSALEQYRQMRREEAATYDFNKDALIDVGYQLLSMKKIDEAIAILNLEVEAFPQYWNAYDSLADAYKAGGQTPLAIANYKRALELNPKDSNATTQLKALTRN